VISRAKPRKAQKQAISGQKDQNATSTTRLQPKIKSAQGTDLAASRKKEVAELKRKLPPKTTQKAASQPDWKAIESDFRAGIKTLRAIAHDHGPISHVAITKRANKFGWERDLAKRIQVKAESLVNKDAVTSLVNKNDERKVVEANAVLQADVIRSHRSDIGRTRAMVNSMLEELGAQNLTAHDIELVANSVAAFGSDSDSGTEMVVKAIMESLSLGARTKIVKDLVDALIKLVTVERTVFGIDKETAGETIEDRLRRIEKDDG